MDRTQNIAVDPTAISALGAVAVAEARSMSEFSARLFRKRWLNAAGGLSTLLQCRTPQDVFALQAAILCEDLDLVRGGCERLSEIISDAAGETVRRLPETGGRRQTPLA